MTLNSSPKQCTEAILLVFLHFAVTLIYPNEKSFKMHEMAGVGLSMILDGFKFSSWKFLLILVMEIAGKFHKFLK
jgi:hypothetical protein